MIIPKPRKIVFLPFLRPRQYLGGMPVYALRPEPVRIEPVRPEPVRQKPAMDSDAE